MSSPIDADIEHSVDNYLDLQVDNASKNTAEVTFNVQETPSALKNSDSEL